MDDAKKKRVLDVLKCTVSYMADKGTVGPLKHYAKHERHWSRSGMMSHVRELERKLKLVTEVNKALIEELEKKP
jgi:hypothetical protein